MNDITVGDNASLGTMVDPQVTAGVNYPVVDNQFFRTVNAIWPDLLNQKANIAPVRNGMNRFTGKLLQEWPHVEQSMEVIFATPYHERVLRRWVGSFVPMLLGENYVDRIVMRFYWAIVSAIDLWEPNYRIRRVYFMGDALEGWTPSSQSLPQISTDAMIRLGQAIFRNEGIYRPRGHLGDFSPWEMKRSAIVGRGDTMWDVKAAP